MNDDLKTYINFLFEGLEGYVYAPVKRPDRWDSAFFVYPAEADSLQAWIETSNRDDGAHVYISPGVYSRKEATTKALKELQVCWVEFDGQDQINFRELPEPSAIIQSSSSTHVHAYWRIPTSGSEVVADVNKRITYYLGADLSGHDPTQLLRPPGTINRKHDLPVIMADFQNSSHRLDDFDSAPRVQTAVVGVIEEAELLKTNDVFKDYSLSNKLIKLVKNETPPVGSRSSFMTMLAYELAEEGLKHAEIVSLLHHADERVGKFRDRSDRLLRLTQLAELALHKVLVENSLSVYTFDDILNSKRKLEWILPLNWLHRTGQMILSSAPGVGKTQLILQLSTCLALNDYFLGSKCLQSVEHSILFLSLEMDVVPLEYFIRQQKVNWSSSPKNIHVIDEPASLTMYENEIERLGVTVLVIDSLTELLDGLADNPNDAARSAMKWCKKVRRRYNCAIILIHHNRKASEGNKKPKSIHDLAGSYQFAQSSDTVAQLWEDNKGIELSTVKCRFGPNTSFIVERSSSLWFSRTGDSNQSETVREDSSNQTSGRDDQGTSELQSSKEEVNVDRGTKPAESGPTVGLEF